MFNNKYLRYLIIFIVCEMNSLGLFYINAINAQQKFLLTEDEMPGFALRSQSNSIWTIGEGKHHDVILQWWQKIGTSNEFNIYYCEFDNEVEAILGTSYAATRSNSIAFTWGYLTGSIRGDGSWVSDGALYFVRGNVGIKIFSPFFVDDDLLVLDGLANEILDKIEMNLSQDILELEELVKQKQIPASDYQTVTEPVINSTLMSNYSLLSTWDSKWLVDSVSLTMGIRKEWKNAAGAVVSFDICKYENEEQARNAIAMRSKHIPTTRSMELDNLDSLQSIVQTFKDKNNRKTSYFMLGFKDNITVHYYHFNPDTIDWDDFYGIAEGLSEQIVNF